MKEECKLYVVHVAGTRMIEQGTDGVSREVSEREVSRGETCYHLLISEGADEC